MKSKAKRKREPRAEVRWVDVAGGGLRSLYPFRSGGREPRFTEAVKLDRDGYAYGYEWEPGMGAGIGLCMGVVSDCDVDKWIELMRSIGYGDAAEITRRLERP